MQVNDVTRQFRNSPLSIKSHVLNIEAVFIRREPVVLSPSMDSYSAHVVAVLQVGAEVRIDSGPESFFFGGVPPMVEYEFRRDGSCRGRG